MIILSINFKEKVKVLNYFLNISYLINFKMLHHDTRKKTKQLDDYIYQYLLLLRANLKNKCHFFDERLCTNSIKMLFNRFLSFTIEILEN